VYRKLGAPEVLQSIEGVFDAIPLFVEAPVEAERLLSIALVGNDRIGSAIRQRLAELRAVVGFVARKPSSFA
jgi:hypothetical protein